MRPHTLAHLLLLAVVLLWGAMFVVVKDALAGVSPLVFVLGRMTLAAFALFLFFGSRLRHSPPLHWALGALAGVFLAGGYALQTIGLQSITPARSAFLTGAVVLMVPVLSLIPWVRVPGSGVPKPMAFVGAGLGFVGLALLATRGGGIEGLRLGYGELLTLGCALSFTLHLLTLARASQRMHYGELAVLQIGFAAMVTLLLMPFAEPHPRLHPSPGLWIALLAAGLLATAAAFAIQSWAQKYLPATHTALILALEPVFAAAASYLAGMERLGTRGLTGAAMVLAGMLLAELAPAGVQPTAHETAPPF